MNILPPVLLAAFLAAGCVSSAPRSRTAAPKPAPSSPAAARPIDAEAAKLLEVDRDFARDSVARGAAAAFLKVTDAESLRVVPAGAMPRGTDEFHQALMLLPQGARLSWIPREATVAKGGDMGWTWGDYEYRPGPSEGGKPGRGRYLTVWRRGADGAWRISADVGTATVE